VIPEWSSAWLPERARQHRVSTRQFHAIVVSVRYAARNENFVLVPLIA
jgi:hypothetical protein